MLRRVEMSSHLKSLLHSSRLLILLVAGLVGWNPPLEAQTGPPPPDFLVTLRSGLDFDATLANLKQAIESENLMVVQEIDPQQMLRLVGMRIPGMRQILFFHPRYMKQILETNGNGGIEAPLKIIVMERPDGRIMVRYHDPVHQFAPYDGLEEIAAEFRGVIERIVASIRQ